MRFEGLELAPAVIVRVAAWPLGAVTCFGRTGIAPLARDSRASKAPAYLDAYRAAVEDERSRLWERTVGDSRFMRALAIANPELARGLLGRSRPLERNKATRHLETTLYRYLARACFRSQPGDMWATATLVGWGPRRVIEPRRGRCLVAPDLAAFRTIVNVLAVRSPYLERGPYKLNPTLTPRDDRSYLLWSPPGARPSVQRRLPPGGQVDAIFAALRSAPTWTRTAAAAVVASRLGVSAEAARRAIDRLCDQGVLVGGLAFPRRFSDPWEPLEQLERELEAEHAAAWRRTRLRLAGLASELAGVIQSCDPAMVIAAMDAGRAALVELARALAIEPFVPPRAAFRCDFESPWHIQLGPDDARALERTIDAYVRYEHEEGVHRPLVEAAIDRALEGGGGIGAVEPAQYGSSMDGGVMPWDAVLAAYGSSSELRRRCARLQHQLDPPSPEVRATTGAHHATEGIGPAVAALHCSLAPPELGSSVVVHGVSLDATAAYARFASLLEPAPEQPLARWFRGAYRRLGERTGAEAVALLYDHATPNVLAHPDLWTAVLDPWGITLNQLPDRSIRLLPGPSRHQLVVSVDGRAVTVFAPTAANPRSDDPCLQALLLSSMHAPALPVPGTKVVHATEIESSRHRPRLRLDDGAVIQGRRTVVMAADLQPMLSVRGAARFAAWQQLATRHAWPELVLLHGMGTLPLVVPRDSPLAIEAAFEGAGALRSLIVEEFIRSAWVGEGDADHLHVADLVVPYTWALDRGAARHVATEGTP